MASDKTSVMLKITGGVTSEQARELEQLPSAEEGVHAVRRSQRLRDVFLVDYDPHGITSLDLLETARHAGSNGRLIGM